MSTDEDSLGSPLMPGTPSPPPPPIERTGPTGKRIPEVLRHQQSFEARYSSLIQKQIWETSINKDVLERQLNAYFPFGRSASLNKETSDGFDHLKLSPSTSSSSSSVVATSTIKAKSVGTTPTKRLEKSDRNFLDKSETEQQTKKKPL